MNRAKYRQGGVRIPFDNAGFQQLQLHSVIDALNRDEEKRPRRNGKDVEWHLVNMKSRQLEMQRLIGLWDVAKGNIELLFRKHPKIQQSCREGKTFLIPARDGAAQLAWIPRLTTDGLVPGQAEAWSLFIWFMLNPKAKQLGGPCARCGKYFQKRDPRQKTYCSRSCGNSRTAAAVTKEQRERRYQEKIGEVELAKKTWERRGRKGDWKKWVAYETGFNVRFITQAVTRGNLMPPGP